MTFMVFYPKNKGNRLSQLKRNGSDSTDRRQTKIHINEVIEIHVNEGPSIYSEAVEQLVMKENDHAVLSDFYFSRSISYGFW